MRDEKDIFNIIKETYPQIPSRDFIVSTEKKLRKKARSMNGRWKFKRLSVISSGFLLIAFAFSWLFLLSEETILQVQNNPGKDSTSIVIDEEKLPLVYIYHSHNNESYIPELNVKDANDAFSDTKNVTMVGKELSTALKEYNIDSIYDNTDVSEILTERNLSYSDSYKVSREELQEVAKEHKSIKMVFDIHRDSQKRSRTTVNIDGKDYARIMFVVSKTSDNYEENRKFAKLLHEKLEELYPGLSRGLIEKGEEPKNTYNQDLVENSVLLNIGGIENTLDESYRTTHAFAAVIKEVIDMKEEYK